MAPLARRRSDGSSEMSTDWLAFFASAEKSGSCRRPGSAAAARVGSARNALTRMTARNRIAVSREQVRSSAFTARASGVGILLTSDSGAHDVDVVTRDAQRLQELSAGLICARSIQRMLSKLDEGDARDEARGQGC